MKKVLSTLLLASATTMIFGQVVINEDFNSLTVGNLGTDVTGATPGQNGWYTDQGSNADYQITAIDVAHGNSLTLTTGSGAVSADHRFIWKNFSTTASAGNNWIVGKFDIYTGAATGNAQAYCTIYSTTPIAALIYDLTTKKFIGAGRYTNSSGTTGFYSFGNIGTATYPANTWVTVTVAYNKTTGGFSFTTPEGTYTVSTVTAPAALIPNQTATEADFYVINTTGNTVSNTVGFDNITFAFSSTSTLNTGEVIQKSIPKIAIYPNPTSDILNIGTKEKVQSAAIFDMTGRKIEAKVMDNAVDVSNLERGTYIINIQTEKGITSEKFIKK